MSSKFLIVGLGNIGAEYDNTRHNIGFKVLDAMAKLKEMAFDLERLAFTSQVSLKGKKLFLIKPTTYMNLSGRALKYYMDKENIPIENVLVITDDLALPISKARLRANGSHAGHNGLRNIEEILLHNKFARLRFGIGNEFKTGQQVDFVLGKWTKEEEIIVELKIAACIEAIENFVLVNIATAMNVLNAKSFV